MEFILEIKLMNLAPHPPKGQGEQQIHAGSRKSWAWMDIAYTDDGSRPPSPLYIWYVTINKGASMLYHCVPSQKKNKQQHWFK
jgi:hypothetical protein